MPGSDPLGPVQIGAREIYDAVVRVGNAVERLTDQHADTERTVGDHEQRLRVQEDVRAAPRLKVLEEIRLPAIEDRVRGIEARLWPLPAASLLLALAALAVGLIPKLTN